MRIAAIQTLRPVMHQGAHEMILEMVAFRSPNVVQIKAFYGDDLKVNFCGKMATDPHPQVSSWLLCGSACAPLCIWIFTTATCNNCRSAPAMLDCIAQQPTHAGCCFVSNTVLLYCCRDSATFRKQNRTILSRSLAERILCVQVRLEFLHMLGDWMLHLRERVDHEHRLLPYVLSALSDDNPQIQAAALALIDQLGAAYEKVRRAAAAGRTSLVLRSEMSWLTSRSISPVGPTGRSVRKARLALAFLIPAA